VPEARKPSLFELSADLEPQQAKCDPNNGCHHRKECDSGSTCSTYSPCERNEAERESELGQNCGRDQ
jgi:hypothetical protein